MDAGLEGPKCIHSHQRLNSEHHARYNTLFDIFHTTNHTNHKQCHSEFYTHTSFYGRYIHNHLLDMCNNRHRDILILPGLGP